MSGLGFAMLSLTAFRIWRLVGKDDITQPGRDFICRETAGSVRRYLRKLIECNWCSGTWIALATVYVAERWFADLTPHWLWWGIAAAAVVGFLGEIDARLTE